MASLKRSNASVLEGDGDAAPKRRLTHKTSCATTTVDSDTESYCQELSLRTLTPFEVLQVKQRLLQMRRCLQDDVQVSVCLRPTEWAETCARLANLEPIVHLLLLLLQQQQLQLRLQPRLRRLLRLLLLHVLLTPPLLLPPPQLLLLMLLLL